MNLVYLLKCEVNAENALLAEQYIQALTVEVLEGRRSLKTAQDDAAELRSRYATEFRKMSVKQ